MHRSNNYKLDNLCENFIKTDTFLFVKTPTKIFNSNIPSTPSWFVNICTQPIFGPLVTPLKSIFDSSQEDSFLHLWFAPIMKSRHLEWILRVSEVQFDHYQGFHHFGTQTNPQRADKWPWVCHYVVEVHQQADCFFSLFTNMGASYKLNVNIFLLK